MAGFNKVFLIGNLTKDPELRYTPGGAAVSDLRLAVNRTYTTKEGERREEVLYIDVAVWNRQAENCCQYLKKGRPVHVEGYLKMESWDDKTTGEKKTKVKVEAESVQFLGGRDEAGGSSGDGDGPAREPYRRPAEGRAPTNGTAPRSNGPPAAAPRKPAAPPQQQADEDDDIPF